jgi:glutaredoxin domain-containing cysteine-rich protein 1
MKQSKTFNTMPTTYAAHKTFNNNKLFLCDDVSVASNHSNHSDVDVSSESIHRHILKIKISQDDHNKIPANNKMSFVAINNKNHKINNNNNHKSCVQIISRNDYNENLCDDQKLVLKPKKAITKSEIIRMSMYRSGQCSPETSGGEDHLDSGTCSDVEANPMIFDNNNPPPLPPKTYKKNIKLSESTCSDASSASSSSDSMQYQLMSPDLIRSIQNKNNNTNLPTTLLTDIRNHSSIKSFHDEDTTSSLDDEDFDLHYSDILVCNNKNIVSNVNVVAHDDDEEYRNSDKKLNYYDDDKYYKFHINENFALNECSNSEKQSHDESDESFAGYKDIINGSSTSTIRSSKGTIRGVKNRVRNGIATFLQMQQNTVRVSSNIIHTL